MSYQQERERFGLSRDKFSKLSRRAGLNISAYRLTQFEETGKGLNKDEQAYIQYMFGDHNQTVDWKIVEKGAPVIVAGEKGTFSFHSIGDDGSIMVFQDRFRHFSRDKVRLVSPEVLPPIENAHLFESRSGNTKKAIISGHIMSYYRDDMFSADRLKDDLGLSGSTVSVALKTLLEEKVIERPFRGVYRYLGQEPTQRMF